MRKRFDKLVAAFLAVMLCVAFVPLAAIAASPDGDGNPDITVTETEGEEGTGTGEENPDPNAGIALTNLEEEGDPVDDGEPVTPDPVVEPEVPEVVEPVEGNEEPTGEEGVEPTISLASDVEDTEETEEEVVEDENVVAIVGEDKFESIDDALTAMKDGIASGDLNIVKDVVESVKIPSNITINLNGHTWLGVSGSVLTCDSANPDITINGPGTIQASNGYRAITLASSKSGSYLDGALGGKITLNNIELLGNGVGISKEKTANRVGSYSSYFPQAGGILYTVNTKIFASNCSFKNGVNKNGTTACVGGAIAVVPQNEDNSKNCQIALDGCNFSGNSSYKGAAVSIDWYAGSDELKVDITNTTFENNSLSYAVNLVLNQNCSSRLNLNLSNDTFLNNSSGAINMDNAFASGGKIVATISACDFTENKVETSTGYDGGSAIRGKCKLSLENNIKVNNKCAFRSNEAGGSAGCGAINIQNTKCSIDDCVFDSNTGKQGGAIFLSSFKPETTITNCDFSGNYCTNNVKGGGAIYATSADNDLKISGCVLNNNKAEKGYGGAICCDVKSLSISNQSKISGNSALKGGALYVTAEKISVSNSEISKNSATVKNTSTVLTSALSTSNVSAGGIHFIPSKDGSEVEISEDSRLYWNTTPNESYVLSPEGSGASSELLIADTSSKKTVANPELDGRLGLTGSAEEIQLIKYDKASTNNTYKYYQRYYNKVLKAVYIDPSNSCGHVNNENRVVCKNVSEAVKAADRIGAKSIIVCSETSISDADSANFTRDSDSALCFYRCYCGKTHNGSMFSISGNVAFENVTFDGIKVPSNSAMLTIQNNSNVTLGVGSVFKNAYRNSAPSSDSWSPGGSVIEAKHYGTDPNRVLTIKGASICDNKCDGDGGAVWIWNTTLNIEDGDFSSNHSNRYGGFLHAEWESQVNINGGEFFNNSSRKEGGAICLRSYMKKNGPSATIYGGTFDSNSSGLLWTDNGIYGGAAYHAGGAIYVDTGSTLRLKNVIATENYRLGNPTTSYEYVAAIANCHFADCVIYEQDGALVYNNKNQGDVSMRVVSGSNPTATVSDFALGGGYCDWHRIDAFGSGPLYEVDKSYYQNTHKSFNIVSIPSEETIQWAWGQPEKVVFKNNSSYLQGSAIMNNGVMIIGSDTKGLNVSKSWKDKDGESLDQESIPDEITVRLAYKDANDEIKLVEKETRPKDFEQKLTKSNEWKASWTDLGTEKEWTVVEVDEDFGGYNVDVSYSDPRTTYEGLVEYDNLVLTNTWSDERTNISAQKWWEDKDNLYKIRPQSIELTLVVDSNNNGIADEDEKDAESAKKVDVFDTDDWRYEFTDLPKYTKKGEEIKYLVAETPVDGYVSNVEPAQKTDENGEPVFDEEGNPVLAWIDDDNMWWSAFNITNSLDFADIELTKTFNGQIYQDGDGNNNSTAVFRITGEFEGTDYKYDNVISVIFDSSDTSDTQSVPVNGLLVGGIYTIEELSFNGSGYEGSGEVYKFKMTKEGPVAIDGDSDEIITIVFTNTGDDEENPNQGVINRYKFESGNKSWEQIGPKQDQAA